MTSSSRQQRICITLGALVLIALAIPGATHAAGVNLSWDDCGTAGTVDKTFACNTNTGAAVLVGSFVAPSGITQLVGIAVTLDVWTSSDSLPSWWQFSDGSCRDGRLTASFEFVSGPSTCSDLWSGGATGGRDYALDSLGAAHARLRLVAAVPETGPITLQADQEYYAFKVTLSFQKTAGTGSCGGCDVPVSIALSSITLAQPAGVGDLILTDAASNNIATWQGGAGTQYAAQSTHFGQIRSILR